MNGELRSEFQFLSSQVTKLMKELGPVRNGLQALRKREEANPSAANTAESLGRIAARVKEVNARYEPFFSRANTLLHAELIPTSCDSILTEVVADGEATALLKPQTTSEKRLRESQADDDRCSAAPLLARGEDLDRKMNARASRQRREMQHDIVEFLLRTDRQTEALEVAKFYGIPLHYFSDSLLSAESGGSVRNQQREMSGDSTDNGPAFMGSSALQSTLFRRVYPQLVEIGAKNQAVPTGPASAARASTTGTEIRGVQTRSNDEHGDFRVEELASSIQTLIDKAERLLEVDKQDESPSSFVASASASPSSASAAEPHHALMHRAKITFVQLQCVKLLQLHAAGSASQNDIFNFIASQLLPHAILLPQLIQHTIHFVTAAGCGGKLLQDAQQTVADILSARSLQGLRQRGSEVAQLLAESIRVQEEWQRAQRERRKPLPQLVARCVAAAIELSDDFADSVFRRPVAYSSRTQEAAESKGKPDASTLSGVGDEALFSQLIRCTLGDMLACTASHQNETSGTSGGGPACDNHNAVASFEHLFTKVFSFKRTSQLVCSSEAICCIGVADPDAEEEDIDDDEEKYFLALPNGYVVSSSTVARQGFRKPTSGGGGGGEDVLWITCPKTGSEFKVTDLRRIYLT